VTTMLKMTLLRSMATWYTGRALVDVYRLVRLAPVSDSPLLGDGDAQPSHARGTVLESGA